MSLQRPSTVLQKRFAIWLIGLGEYEKDRTLNMDKIVIATTKAAALDFIVDKRYRKEEGDFKLLEDKEVGSTRKTSRIMQ